MPIIGSYSENKILLILNPISGKSYGKSNVYRIVDLFVENGYEVCLQKTAYKGHAMEIVQQQGEDHDIIVCCGGDGTLNEVVSGIMKAGIKKRLGYIPMGTTNDFATTLNLSYNIEKAAKTIMGGNVRKLDIGCFMDNRYFNYIASFGAFTHSSYSTPQSHKNAIGHLAYILEGVKDIPNIRPHHVKIEADGRVLEDDYVFGAVSNSISIGGVVKLDSEQVDLNDGLFEILLIKNPKTPIEFSRIIKAITMKDYNDKMLDFVKAKEAVFHIEECIPWSIDGEYDAGANKIHVCNIRDAITLLI